MYSHTLGLIDTNAASTSAVPAARLQAALAGGGGATGGGGAAGGGGGGGLGGGGEVEGIGLYPRFSWSNHCCMPSAVNSKGPAHGDALCEQQGRCGLGASAALAAGWPRLVEASASLRHDLALKAASGEPAGRVLSPLISI